MAFEDDVFLHLEQSTMPRFQPNHNQESPLLAVVLLG